MILDETRYLREMIPAHDTFNGIPTRLLLGKDDLRMFSLLYINHDVWDGQMQMFDAIMKNTFSVHSVGRRGSKTYTGAMTALHNGFYRVRPFITESMKANGAMSVYKILITSRTQRQANIMLNNAVRMMASKESLLQEYFVGMDMSQKFPILRFRSYNGEPVEVHARSAKDPHALQGENYDLILIDEAARIPRLRDVLMNETLIMMLRDTNGRLALLSSPTLHLGDFYMYFKQGLENTREHKKGWKSVRVDSRANPFVGGMDELIAELSDQLADIYLGGHFPTQNFGIFDIDTIENMWVYDEKIGDYMKFEIDNIMLGDGTIPFSYTMPKNKENIFTFADVAKSQDWTVIFTVEERHGKMYVVGFQRFQGKPWDVIADEIVNQHKHFSNELKIAIDNTGVGDAVSDFIKREHNYDPIRVNINGSNKDRMIANLQNTLRKGNIKSPYIQRVEEELLQYVLPDKNIVQDCVMALSIGAWVFAGKHTEEITIDSQTLNWIGNTRRKRKISDSIQF